MSDSIYIYKVLKKGMAPIARLSLLAHSVTVDSSEVEIRQVLKGIFSRPALISSWKGDDLIKRKPESLEEFVTAGLKRFLSRPYFASRDVPETFTPRYTVSLEVNDVP